jgi:Holliday junction resolvase RusA-like endonuclease
MKWYIIEDVNPQPWAIGPLGVGRRPGGMYPYVGPNKQLTTFQNAIREELSDLEGLSFEGDVELEFFVWRKIEQHQGSSRKISGHQADATNIQKALEDALQGCLFANDRQVRRISTTVVEQGRDVKPRIVIAAAAFRGFDPSHIPDFIWMEIDKAPTLAVMDNSWKLESEEVF